MAHPRGGFSYVLACNSADSGSREPVLQHAMYYRLYHRSRFAGRKTYARQYARHVPLRVAPAGCAARPSVDHRGAFPGDPTVTESPRQPVGQPPESGEPVSLTGRCRGSRETGLEGGYAWATPPPTGTGMSVGGGFSVVRLSGWVMGQRCLAFGPKTKFAMSQKFSEHNANSLCKIAERKRCLRDLVES